MLNAQVVSVYVLPVRHKSREAHSITASIGSERTVQDFGASSNFLGPYFHGNFKGGRIESLLEFHPTSHGEEKRHTIGATE